MNLDLVQVNRIPIAAQELLGHIACGVLVAKLQKSDCVRLQHVHSTTLGWGDVMRILLIDQIRGRGASARNNDTLSFSSFSINKHIDKFKSSIRDSYFKNDIDNALKGMGFDKIKYRKIDNGNYAMNREYRRDRDKVIINLLHGLKNLRHGMPELLLTVHNPHLEFINLMRAIFEYHNIKPKLSEVELAFDFDVNQLFMMFQLLRRHLYMNYQRTLSNDHYTTTFYTNNIRRSKYGVKIYIRRKERLVRLELTLKRENLKKLNVDPFLGGIEDVDLSRFFTFCEFDVGRLRQYLKKQCKAEIDRLKTLDPKRASLFVGHIEGWIRGAVCSSDSLMGKLEVLKTENGVRNYSRYFPPFTAFISRFNEEVNAQQFIKKRE